MKKFLILFLFLAGLHQSQAQDIHNRWMVLAYGHQFNVLEINDETLTQRVLDVNSFEERKQQPKTYKIAQSIHKKNQGKIILEDDGGYISFNYFDVKPGKSTLIQIEMDGIKIKKFQTIEEAARSRGARELGILYRTQPELENFSSMKLISKMPKEDYINVLKTFSRIKTEEVEAKARKMGLIGSIYYDEIMTQVLVDLGYHPFQGRNLLGRPYIEDADIQQLISELSRH